MPKRAGSPTDPKPIAVVGSGGFIGAALTARLTADGVPVRLFTRRLPFLSPSGRLCADAATSQTLVWLASSVNPAIAQQRPDLVEADHAAFDELLRGAGSTTDPPRIVLVSSGGTVYDASAAPPYREDGPTKAANAYGESKLRMERALEVSGLDRAVLRVSNAYGPGQPARRGLGVIAHWLHAVANGERPVILGAPETARDYVYIDDIVSALVAVHEHPGALPEVLNIGSGVATSLDDLAEIVLKVVGDPALSFEVRPPRSFDVAQTWLDVSLAHQTLGWQPHVSIADGIGATWSALLAPQATLASEP